LTTSDGKARFIEGILDTGFSGYLSLPLIQIREYGLQWHRIGRAMMANGRIERFNLYHAIVTLEGRSRRITVYAIEGTPLLGVRLFMDFDLRTRIQVGGGVEMERIV